MEDALQLPHKLTLAQREDLSLTGVTEVVSFDDTAVVLRTELGTLVIQGQELQLKTLSIDGGQVAVDGEISALLSVHVAFLMSVSCEDYLAAEILYLIQHPGHNSNSLGRTQRTVDKVILHVYNY